MASVAEPRPVSGRFGDFLKAELRLRPGMYSVLLRIVIAVVITFILAATFRMPYAAITLYSIFTVDRSSHRASLVRAIESVVAVTIGVTLGLLGVVLFADFPLLNFAYYGLEIFIAAFLIRTARVPGPALNMAMAVYSVHNVWERPYPAGPHIEQTLWVWLTLCLGFVVAVAVELALVREDPLTQVTSEITERLRTLSELFSAYAMQAPDLESAKRALYSYALSSTAGPRARINAMRHTDPAVRHQAPGLTALTALTGRLIDVSATIDVSLPVSNDDRHRLLALASELERTRAALKAGFFPHPDQYCPTMDGSVSLPMLAELERSVSLIPAALSAAEVAAFDPVAAETLIPPERFKIFVPDAFENAGYLLFALKTTIAALLCYVMYSALNWPGISTSVVTCLVTATNTIGATKQKQILRLAGASCGGLIAIGALVFLLPEIDSITGITAVIAAVTAFSGRIALSSPRVSYFGLQTALAFYLAIIQEYSAATQLAPARDRILGVLLGITTMWLVFDTLWPVSASEHMRKGLARNLRLLAQLFTVLDQPDRAIAIRTIRDIRDRLQQGFAAVHDHADSVLFEFGSPQRRYQLALREAILRWQATARTLFVTEIAICQYRTQVVPGTRPAFVRNAQRAFDYTVETAMRELADSVDSLRVTSKFPDVVSSFSSFEETVTPWVHNLPDQWIKTRAEGILALSQRLAEMTESLAADLRTSVPARNENNSLSHLESDR